MLIWWTHWDPVPSRPWCLIDQNGRRLRDDRFQTIRFHTAPDALDHAVGAGMTLAVRDGKVVETSWGRASGDACDCNEGRG